MGEGVGEGGAVGDGDAAVFELAEEGGLLEADGIVGIPAGAGEAGDLGGGFGDSGFEEGLLGGDGEFDRGRREHRSGFGGERVLALLVEGDGGVEGHAGLDLPVGELGADVGEGFLVGVGAFGDGFAILAVEPLGFAGLLGEVEEFLEGVLFFGEFGAGDEIALFLDASEVAGGGVVGRGGGGIRRVVVRLESGR